MGLTKRGEKEYVLFYEKSDTSDYNCIPFSASQPLLVSSLPGNVAFVNQTRWQWRILNSKVWISCHIQQLTNSSVDSMYDLGVESSFNFPPPFLITSSERSPIDL